MARIKDREKAIKLREQGLTYNQIKERLNVAKSTLSSWLSDYPLSDMARKRIEDKKQIRIENYIITRRKNREALLKKIYQNQEKKILPLSKRDLFVAGLCLYWGEGSKFKTRYELRVTNSDPAVINAFIHWLEESLKVERKKVSLKLYLYQDMSVIKEKKWWSSATGIPLSQFKNPSIKKIKPGRLTYKGAHGHGTCNAIMNNANLGKQVAMSIDVIRKYFLRP